MTDHSHLNVQLGFLSDALERIHLTGFNLDDFKLIEKVIQYLNSELKIHNQLEENNLFTKAKSNINLKNLSTTLIAEHRVIWDKLELLNGILNQYKQNQTASIFSDFYKISVSLMQLIRNHIEKEDTQFFPHIEKTLKASEVEELNKLV